MSESFLYHRQIGVYGICYHNDRLLVIYKNKGPYTGRFDLPGGSIEPNETLLEAVHREFHEETGLQVRVVKQIGTRDFVVPWTRPHFEHTHCHHIGTFYQVEYVTGDVNDSPNIDDSNGAAWIPLEKLNTGNSSPLVTAAIEWLAKSEFPLEATRYSDWTIKTIDDFSPSEA